MDRLHCLKIFSEVARCGSFTRASAKLSLSRATVTKHIAWLELSMGAQLLNRGPKQVALTEAGVRALEAAADMLARYDAMEVDVRDSVRLPRGAIRIGAPPSFGSQQLMTVLKRFTERYPDIEVTVVLDTGTRAPPDDALDLSIRVLPTLKDSSFIAHPLMRAPQTLVASRQYLAGRGAPRNIRELVRHNCLVQSTQASVGIWSFPGQDPDHVRVRGTIRSNFATALKEAALLGAGISLLPVYMTASEVRDGLLEVVLPECRPQTLDVSVVYSTRRNMPVRVRHLLDHLKEWALDPPAWTLETSLSERPAARLRAPSRRAQHTPEAA